jgi:hypothetical protein
MHKTAPSDLHAPAGACPLAAHPQPRARTSQARAAHQPHSHGAVESSRRDAAAVGVARAGGARARRSDAAAAADAAAAPVARGAHVTLCRRFIACAGLSIALGVGLGPAATAQAVGTIWPECVSGSVAQTCQTSSWYAGPVAVVWRASPSPEETSPCLLGIEYPFETDSVTTLAWNARRTPMAGTTIPSRSPSLATATLVRPHARQALRRRQPPIRAPTRRVRAWRARASILLGSLPR